MPVQSWQGTLITAQADGAALANAIGPTSILPAQAKYTLAANFLDAVGKQLRIRASGRVSMLASATLALTVKFGATSVAASPTWTLNATAKTNVTWILDLVLHLRVVGASAQVIPIGQFTSEAVISSVANTANTAMWPLTAPAVGTAFDSTVAQVVDLQATWGAASASNTIQLHGYALESMN
ncbi:MAG TPA: hypothetical protein VJ966_14075 [Actinomycetes bacterium]|nr:hypothetical protein [Actinomycetes bacterium]